MGELVMKIYIQKNMMQQKTSDTERLNELNVHLVSYPSVL